MESLKSVFKRRERATEAAWRVLSQTDKIDATTVARTAESVLAVLPDGCRYDALFRTLAVLTGQVPDRLAVRMLLWAVAAGVTTLRAGTPVAAARVPIDPARAAIQIVAATRARFKNKKDSAARFRGRIVSGAGCPAVIEWGWSLKFVAYVATRGDGLGFRGRKPGSPGRLYQHFSTLVGTRMTCDVSTVDEKVKVTAVRCPPSFRSHNQSLTDMRWRFNFACPFLFTHPCHNCPKGQASCPAACRSEDLIDKTCTNCKTVYHVDKAWRDEGCPKCRSHLA